MTLSHNRSMNITRRRLLATASAGLMLPFAARADLPTNPDVVVVGAGAAGLAATRTLMEKGLSVALVEAGDRIGGRAFTESDTFGVPFDQGAHWLHHDTSNPYNDYGKDNGFDVYLAPDFTRVFIGDREASASEINTLWKIWETYYDDIGEAAERRMDVSAASVITYKGEWANTVAYGIGPWSMAKDLSDFSITDYWSGADGRDYYCAQGFGTLVAHYGAGIPVSLDTRATHIRWGGPGVEVETSRGTLSAKAVIVTVSTGVLAAGHIAFDPVLPVEKQESFDGISMGLYNHIALQFSEDIFGMGPDGYLMLQVGEDKRGFGALTNASGTGIAYCDVGGSFARQLEKDGEAAAVDFAVGKMKEMLGSFDVDRTLVKSAVTAWAQDPLFEGSYASARPGAYPMRAALRESVGDRIFFAGEACSRKYWATVAGAHMTGVDVADDVADEIA